MIKNILKTYFKAFSNKDLPGLENLKKITKKSSQKTFPKVKGVFNKMTWRSF